MIRYRNKIRLDLFAIGSVVLTALAAPGCVRADNALFTAPDKMITDPNGVDLLSAHLTRPQTFLTIGDPAAGGLVVDYYGPGAHSYAGSIVYWGEKNSTSTPGYVFLNQIRVKFGGVVDTFHMSPSNPTCATPCPNTNGTSATLVKSGINWVYTTSDGTVFRFDALNTPAYSTTTVEQFIGKLLTITKPDGTLITINYDINSTCPSSGLCYRIKSVVSNRGFALRFNYASGGYGSPSSIDGVNLLAHTCDALVTTCDGYDVTQNGALKDALGNQTTIAMTNVGSTDRLDNTLVYSLRTYVSPMGLTTSATYDSYGRIKTLVKPQGTWTYSYSDLTFTQIALPGIRTITVKDPSNATVWTAQVGKGTDDSAGPELNVFTDALGRATHYKNPSYNGGTFFYSRLTAVTKPEGDYIGQTGEVRYAYDARGNVTTVSSIPKAGSGLSATSITADYPSTCTYPKTCNQPTWTKDAKGNQTDYVYDNTHGGVLTVTLPTDAAGLRLRTYNTYTAFDTGNGIVYRLTRSDTCGLTSAQLSLTACPTESNGATAAVAMKTSIRMIDYGTATTAPYTYKSSLPYKVTNRDGRVTAPDLQTTTYAYDTIGNVVSVDGPLAGTVDQSFTTYDANRRKIFEIGPIPGGAGTQKRSLVRHTYNGDGNETQTAVGYANSNATNGSDAVYTSYNRMTYDAAGRLIKTEVISKDVVVP